MGTTDALIPEPEAATKATGNSEWPRISVVTPVLNCASYIEQTIRSVISQSYPNLEYVVVDGGSTDGTFDIIGKYEKHLSCWTSKPDGGMYDALNKGFAQSTGEIMGWISGTDMLHPGSLFVVGSVFRTFPEVEWITGLPSVFNEQGMTIQVPKPARWSRARFLAGANRAIQQESTFWRRSLWEKAGGYVDSSLRMAGDFELWVRFFRHARLYPVEALIGGYRMHGDSLGLTNLDRCHEIQRQIVEKELNSCPWGKTLRMFRKLDDRVMRIRKVRYFWRRLVINSVYQVWGPDWPPVIKYHLNEERWYMKR